MNTAIINIKTEVEVKQKAQKVAKEMGVSLTAVINGYLKHFIKTKSVTFTAEGEIPSKRLIQSMKQAEKNRRAGKTSPIFDNGKDAVAWLEKQGI